MDKTLKNKLSLNAKIVLSCIAWTIGILLFAGAAQSSEYLGIAKVVDGDTIEIDNVRFRINGIDAPEAGQKCIAGGKSWRCGDEATAFMSELVAGKQVSCLGLSTDGYGRIVATCLVDEIDIGAKLIDRGLAWAFTKYSDLYVEQEKTARVLKLGIWNGEAQPAWEFRAAKWKVAEQNSPKGCPIKGNISKNGKIVLPPYN